MKIFLGKKIIFGFLLATGALTWLVILSSQNNKKFLDSSLLIVKTNQILYHAEQVMSIVVDIESGQHGYVITGDSIFLEPYVKAINEVDKNIEELAALVRENKHDMERIQRIKELIRKKNNFTDQTIHVRNLNFEASRKMIASYEGKLLMDQIRDLTDAIEHDARNSLEQQRISRESEMGLFNITFISIIVSAVLLLVLVFIAINFHLSARFRAEESLKTASAEIRDLYDHAPCGYHSIDANGVFANINQTELRWLGYRKDDIIGKMNFLQILSPASLEHWKINFEKLKKAGVIHNVEFDFITKDGTTLPVIINATTITDSRGNFMKTRSTVFDNTERKKMESEIRRASDEVLDLYNNAPCGYFSITADGIITRINNTLLAWLQHSREEVVGIMNISNLFSESTHGSFFDRIETSQENLIHNIDLKFIRKDHQTFPAISSASVQRNNDGSIKIIRCSVIDNADRKKAEDKILQLNSELEAFTYSVSHDLRSPLRLVDGYAQILKEDHSAQLDEDGNRITEIIMSNAKRMGQLIDDLLDFSHMGRKEVMRAKFNFKDMVERVIEQLSHLQNGRDVEISVGNMEQVKADAAMIEQVWVNLISNALKYSSTKEKSKVEIGSYKDNGEVCFFVKDNGVGFNMDYIDKLFGVFQRLHKIEEFSGTGVGLALVKRIITRHGGRVWAEGKINEGATFHFSLPNI